MTRGCDRGRAHRDPFDQEDAMTMTKPYRNYHMCLAPLGRGRWRCDYCGDEMDGSQIRSTDCSHVYEPCKACGGCKESNECKPDCPGMLALLNDPRIYVAGSAAQNHNVPNPQNKMMILIWLPTVCPECHNLTPVEGTEAE